MAPAARLRHRAEGCCSTCLGDNGSTRSRRDETPVGSPCGGGTAATSQEVPQEILPLGYTAEQTSTGLGYLGHPDSSASPHRPGPVLTAPQPRPDAGQSAARD